MATHGIRSLTLTEWHLIAKNIDIQQSQTVLPFSTLKSAHVIQGTCARMPLNVIFFLGIVFDTCEGGGGKTNKTNKTNGNLCFGQPISPICRIELISPIFNAYLCRVSFDI